METSVNSSAANSGSTPAPTDRFALATMPGEANARADLELAYDADRRLLRVRYGVYNFARRSAVAVAVFDRGDAHDIRGGRHTLGAGAAPSATVTGDRIELKHAASPLPNPAPYAPIAPFAMKLEPGTGLVGQYELPLPSDAEPKWVRWCIGMTVFDPPLFDAPRATAYGEICTATFAAVDRQRIVYSPWYEIATRRFAG